MYHTLSAVDTNGITLLSAYAGDPVPTPAGKKSGLPYYASSVRIGHIDGQLLSRHGVNNLLRLFAIATVDQYARGMEWYALARSYCEAIGGHYGYTVNQVAGAISATSPQIAWDWNLLCATYCASVAATGGDCTLAAIGQTYSNRRKAVSFLQGDSGVLTGPKVSSFLDNIAYPRSSQSVTVDSHAVQSYVGCLFKNRQFSVSRYDNIVADFQYCANYVALPPCEFQAIVWIVWRETILGNAPDRWPTLTELISRANSMRR